MNKKEFPHLILTYFVIMALALIDIGCQTPVESEGQVTWVILVRHAEKTGEEVDAPLTEQGQKRAQVLAEMLLEAGVKTIYATQFRRNQMTAQPLSEETGIPVTTLPIEGNTAEHVRQLAALLKSKSHAGELIVCIEHSNTIPLILTELGAESIEGYVDYPQMFIIVLKEGKPAERIILRYDF